jgi:hypothetical protein
VPINQLLKTSSPAPPCRADAIFIATHSQGCPVSTLLLDRLIREGHIKTAGLAVPPIIPGVIDSAMPRTKPQRVCLLGICGVHHGPLRWLHNSNVVNPYITYFESPAARELFDFQVRMAHLSAVVKLPILTVGFCVEFRERSL